MTIPTFSTFSVPTLLMLLAIQVLSEIIQHCGNNILIKKGKANSPILKNNEDMTDKDWIDRATKNPDDPTPLFIYLGMILAQLACIGSSILIIIWCISI